MATAQEIVEDAAALILVDEANTGLEANELQIGVRFLNDLCAELYDDDIDFGYRPVSSPSDVITSPSAVNSALKYMLAKRISPIFGLPIDPMVVMEGTRLEASLNNRYQRALNQVYPDTLPTGAGNYIDSFQIDEFYQAPQPEAFLRLPAAHTVTIAAVNTPVALSSFTVERQINVMSDGSSVTYENAGAYFAMFEAVLTVDGGNDDNLTFYFAKNGVILPQSAVSMRNNVDYELKVRWAENIREYDAITVVVENNDNTNNVTINNGTFRVT